MTNYNFLGSVQHYEVDKTSILLLCEKNYQLKITFLHSNMLQVTLIRPDFAEPLLAHSIDKVNWDVEEIHVHDSGTFLLCSTSKIDLMITKQKCRLTIKNKEGDILCEDDPSMGIGWDGREVRNWKVIADDEKFFGLGEKAGDLNKRGKEWIMWNTDDPYHDNRSDSLYQSIPFFIGIRNTKAYGIFFNNSYRSKFNMGAGNLRYYSFSADGGNLDYYFMYGPEVKDVVTLYTRLTGRFALPPKWSLGYQQCRWSYYPDSELLRIAQTFREKKIPADVIYLDIHYMDGYRVFTWDKERFPKPKEMIQKLEDMGFKLVVIIDPGVKVEENYSVAQEGVKEGHFVKYPDGDLYQGEVWPGPAYFPDFSQEKTRRWWGEKFKGLLDAGVKGFWNDMNEPAVWGKAFPDEVLFSDDGHEANHKKMHNLYGFLMAKACYEGVKKIAPETRPFVITRAGFSGEQRYTAVWTGDNHATEEHLAMSMRMFQGLGISGIPFIGSDIGGFIGTPSPELFLRWLQASIFVPFFRAHTHHGSCAQEPWSFGEDVEALCRKYISKRYEMLPYIYSLFWEANRDGAPIIRPMFWYNQNDPEVYEREYQEQFYVGDSILVAPVVREKQYYKKVYFPKGRWLDPETNEIYDGGKSILLETPLEKLPLFFKEGAIIPTQEAMQYTDEKTLDLLTIEVFPSNMKTSYTLYEDDGISFDYQKGKYSLTKFQCEKSDGVIFEKELLHDEYNVQYNTILVRFYDIENSPKQVRLNQENIDKTSKILKKQGYLYHSEKKILEVFFETNEKRQVLVLKMI